MLAALISSMLHGRSSGQAAGPLTHRNQDLMTAPLARCRTACRQLRRQGPTVQRRTRCRPDPAPRAEPFRARSKRRRRSGSRAEIAEAVMVGTVRRTRTCATGRCRHARASCLTATSSQPTSQHAATAPDRASAQHLTQLRHRRGALRTLWRVVHPAGQTGRLIPGRERIRPIDQHRRRAGEAHPGRLLRRLDLAVLERELVLRLQLVEPLVGLSSVRAPVEVQQGHVRR